MSSDLISLLVLIPIAALTVWFWYNEFTYFKNHMMTINVPKQTNNIITTTYKNVIYLIKLMTGIFLLTPLVLDLFLTLAIANAFGGGNSLMGLAIGLLISDILSGFLAYILRSLPKEV